jgi:hypothetical protein
MGLIADIYKSKYGDCSNGGLSGKVDSVTIINIEGPFEPTEDRPAVLLVTGNLPGTVKIVPASMPEDKRVGPMMGGTYVDTSDSRLGEAIERLGGPRYGGPVPLHDRFETQAEYNSLSI